jgi:hypothetical protein
VCSNCSAGTNVSSDPRFEQIEQLHEITGSSAVVTR